MGNHYDGNDLWKDSEIEKVKLTDEDLLTLAENNEKKADTLLYTDLYEHLKPGKEADLEVKIKLLSNALDLYKRARDFINQTQSKELADILVKGQK